MLEMAEGRFAVVHEKTVVVVWLARHSKQLIRFVSRVDCPLNCFGGGKIGIDRSRLRCWLFFIVVGRTTDYDFLNRIHRNEAVITLLDIEYIQELLFRWIPASLSDREGLTPVANHTACSAICALGEVNSKDFAFYS